MPNSRGQIVLLRQIPHPPPRIKYGAGSDLPLEGGGIQRFPSPSGGGTALHHVGCRTSPEPNMVQGVGVGSDGLCV